MADWRDADNAVAYHDYSEQYSTFRETSVDLVMLAELEEARSVVDLACGTGVTTEAILAKVGPAARVVAIDVSEAMLVIGRRRVIDRRVEWVQSLAAQMGDHVKDADAIVCNSAMWQLDVERTLRAAARTLRKGGTLVFNVPSPVIHIPGTDDGRPSQGPALYDLIREIASRELRNGRPHLEARSVPFFRPLTCEAIVDALRGAGFGPPDVRIFTYESTADALLAWLRVPIFADNVMPGVPHGERIRIMEEAFARFDTAHVRPSRWAAFRASTP